MDNDNTHIDSDFIDHSWQEMSTLLDQEMPVQKRKKRFIWLFFFGIGVLNLLGLTYFTKNNEAKLDAFTIQEASKIATNKITKNSNSHSSINVKKDAIKQVPTKSPDDIDAISTISTVTKNRSTAAKIPTAVEVSATEINSDEAKIPVQITTKPNVFVNKKEIKSASRWQTTTPLIAKLPVNTLKYNNDFVLDLTIPVLKKQQPKWRFGLYAGALTPKIGSFRAGLFTNIDLNKKWSVHFGIGYAKRTPTSSTNNNIELTNPTTEIFQEDNMDTTAGTTAFPSSNTTMSNGMELITNSGITYTNFHYFEIPLLIQYHIRSKLSFEIGGNFSYLYGYNFKYNNASFFSKNGDFVAAINNRTTDLSLINSSTIPTINLNFKGGVSYQLTKKINAYTNYHLSSYYLKSTPTSTFSEKRWQQIEVGIRYFFK